MATSHERVERSYERMERDCKTMSTRAQIMIQKKDEGDGKDWAVGTYHHWDGYPEGLGAYL